MSSAPAAASDQPRVLSSLWQGLRAAFFLRIDPRRIGGDVPSVCLLFLTSVGISLLVACAFMSFKGRFNWNAIAGLFLPIPFLLLAGWVAARRSLRGITPLHFPALALAMGPPVTLIMAAIAWFGARQEWLQYWLYPVLILWSVSVLWVAYVRLVGRGVMRSGAGLLWILLLGAASWLPQPQLILPAPDENEARYEPSIEREDAFHAQAGLLDKSLAQLKPQRSGVEDLYFLGFAGYASEDVFYKELRVIDPLMRERFDAEGRSLLLVNNPKTVLQLPLATGTNLRGALRALGQKINPEEDVVMLYLTSHGSSRHEFSVRFWPLALDDLTPTTLKNMLDEAGIKWRVIVISACYAGGYIGPLKDERTLVMTAADATHTSFGCGSESDFTYFGHALFDEELRKTHSFAEAFGKAKVTIRARELAQGYKPSNPQIAMGTQVEPKLARMAARLDALGLKEAGVAPTRPGTAQPDAAAVQP